MTNMLSTRMQFWVMQLRAAAEMLITEQVLYSQLNLLHVILVRCHQSG